MLFRIPEYLIPSGGSYDIFGEFWIQSSSINYELINSQNYCLLLSTSIANGIVLIAPMINDLKYLSMSELPVMLGYSVREYSVQGLS